MNNKFLGAVLAIFVGIAAGLCFLFTISTVMQQNIRPIGLELQSVNQNLRAIQSQLASGSNDNQLADRLGAIESRLAAMEQRAPAQPPAPPMPPQEDFNKVYDLKVADSPMKGKKGAPVTIVEFTDFQCPFCARFHGPIVETLKAYPNQVNYAIKNFPLPFHPNAKPAAKAALAAGEQGKYFEMADAILEDNQNLSDDKYKELAQKIGLNMKQFEKDLKDKDSKFEAAIAADMQLVDQSDVRGTPTFFINGKKTMARDAAGFKQEIDKILGK